VPLSIWTPRVAVEFSGIPASDPLIGRVVFATHKIGALNLDRGQLVRNIVVAGGSPNPGLPQITQVGYRLRLHASLDGETRVISWDLRFGPEPQHWVTGEDGLIGYPHVGPSTPMRVTR